MNVAPVAASPTENAKYIIESKENVSIAKYVFNNRMYIWLNQVLKVLDVEKNKDNNSGKISFKLSGTNYEIDPNAGMLTKNGYTKIKFTDKVIKKAGNYYLPVQFLSELGLESYYDKATQKLFLVVKKSEFNQEYTKIFDGKKANVIEFDINIDENLFWASIFPHDKLTYSYDQIINLPNSFQIKESYKAKEFSPFFWVRDFRQVIFYGEKNGYESIQSVIDHMYNYITNFIIEEGDKAYIFYPFEHGVYNKRYAAGWQSALGSGHIIYGLVHAYSKTGDKKYKELADKLVNGFLDVRDNEQGHWITFIDENGFLWLEEAPHPDDPQTRILNGHMGAAEALYAYYLIDPREEVLDLIKAAATTVYYYIEDYRIPNNIHAYGLYTDGVLDYGQQRNLNQLEFLYKITKDPYFLLVRSNFDNDYRRSGKTIK